MISVVIPAYNEERKIAGSVKTIASFFADMEIEIIVVDDGSRDHTIERLNETGIASLRVVTNPANRGKGYSMKRGVMESRGEYILLTDTDLSTPIAEFDKLFPCLSEFDVAIGSRGMKESSVKNALHRTWLGTLANRLFIKLLLPGIRDSQCGFKLFRGEAAHRIFSRQTLSGFGYDFEILFIARVNGYRIREVGVTWNHSDESKVRFYHYFATLLEFGRVVLNHLQKKYNGIRPAA